MAVAKKTIKGGNDATRVPITVLIGRPGRKWLHDKAAQQGVSVAAVVRSCLVVARNHERELNNNLEVLRDA